MNVRQQPLNIKKEIIRIKVFYRAHTYQDIREVLEMDKSEEKHKVGEEEQPKDQIKLRASSKLSLRLVNHTQVAL